MKYSIITNNTKVKNVVSELLKKYPALHTDKDIDKTALSDLYMVDNNIRYYVNNGYAERVNKNYRIVVEA
jgi:hypothetical protein